MILWASEKVTMHLEFISGGIRVPYTLIVAEALADAGLLDHEEALAPPTASSSLISLS